jgi:hypothetical protein
MTNASLFSRPIVRLVKDRGAHGKSDDKQNVAHALLPLQTFHIRDAAAKGTFRADTAAHFGSQSQSVPRAAACVERYATVLLLTFLTFVAVYETKGVLGKSLSLLPPSS